MKAYFPEPPIRKDETDLVSSIDSKVEQCVSASTEWADKQTKYYDMRYRIKKDKTFPFKGASNLRMPTVDTQIRKIKSGVMNVVFGLRPVIQAIPSPGGNAQLANNVEKFFDHLICDVMSFKNKATIIVDQALQGGFYLAKPYWRQEIDERVVKISVSDLDPQELAAIISIPTEEIMPIAIERFEIDKSKLVIEENIKALASAIEEVKSGKTEVSFRIKDVIYNAPDVALITPDKVFVPTSSGYHPQESEYVCHEYFLPLTTIKYRSEGRGWSKEGVKELEEFTRFDTKDSKLELDKDAREGITLLQSDGLVKIREYYGYADIGNGKEEKVLVTYAASFGTELRKIKWDSYSGKWPFVKFFYELNDDRWFSHRGIPEMIEDISKEIDTQHNIKIDQQTIRNAPMFVYRSGMVNPNMVQMRPNQAIPVKGSMALGDAVQALNFHNPSIEYSYEREQQLLESKIQELLGQPDYSLQSMINRREPRTLGEVQMQASAYNNIFALDASMFTDSFTQLFNMILELWCMYGEDEYEFKYFGNNKIPETIKLNREEIQNKFTITVRGNDTNSNPNVRLQKAQQIILAVTNPVMLQSGIVGPQQQIEALKEFYQALDISNYDRFFNPNPAPPAPPPVGAIVKPSFKDLTTSEQAQVVSSIGIQPDVPQRGYDQDRRVASEEADIAKQIVESMGV